MYLHFPFPEEMVKGEDERTCLHVSVLSRQIYRAHCKNRNECCRKGLRIVPSEIRYAKKEGFFFL
jgi:hypothetical protein